MPQRALLLSLKSKYAAAIYDGRKSYEFRRVWPRCTTPIRAFIYETMPAGVVTGYVEIIAIVPATPEGLLDLVPTHDAMRGDYHAYLGGATNPVALVLGESRCFATPLSLTDAFGPGVKAPQSYRFVDDSHLVPLLSS